MDYSGAHPREADVDMAMHDDALLADVAAQYAHQSAGQGGPANPGQQPQMEPQPLFPGVYVPGLSSMDPSQQNPPGVDPMEEYARLMGVKLEVPTDEQMAAAAAFNGGLHDVSKMQANQAYFENLVRERGGMLGELDENAGPSNVPNVTSMTLPAGIGSGLGGAASMFGAAAGNMYNPASELAFNDMNRLYDPSSGFPGVAGPGVSLPYKPLDGKFQPSMVPPSALGGRFDLTSQTLPPEIFTQRMKDSAEFGNLNEDEKLALLKEAKSRERNRDHSRKSRLRKKEFVESLKQEVAQLHMYREMCEQSPDLLALVAPEPAAVLLYTSSGYSRALGYQSHQLVPGQTSFLDLVHPVRSSVAAFMMVLGVYVGLIRLFLLELMQENVQEVRATLQKLATINESRKCEPPFRFMTLLWDHSDVILALCCSPIPDKGGGRRVRAGQDVRAHDGEGTHLLDPRGPRLVINA